MASPAVRISVGATGEQGNAASGSPTFLYDNRTVVFLSNSSNLVLGDNNARADIFSKDIVTGDTRKLTPVNFSQDISNFSIASDGGTIAFVTNPVTSGSVTSYSLYTLNVSDGLIAEVTNSKYINDPLASSLLPTRNDHTIDPRFSPDGKKLVFSSSDTGLVAGDTNNQADVFVKDLANGSIIRVSTAVDGSQAMPSGKLGSSALSNSYHPFFTPDGSKVIFTSSASNLVAGDGNGRADTFVKDLNTGEIHLVPTSIPALQAENISKDGTKILLESYEAVTTGGGIPGIQSLYTQDIQIGVTNQVEMWRQPYGNGSYQASFSPDGMNVIYSQSGYFFGGSNILLKQPYIEDLATGIRVNISGIQNMVSGGDGYSASFSPDGTKAIFVSNLANLVINDTNNAPDVFVRDLFDPVFGRKVTDASEAGGKVYALYEGLLGRSPDSLGLEVNAGAVNAGLSLRDLAAAMLGSPEDQARSGAATDTAFVTQLYRTTLEREPDAAGLDNWVKFLGAGGARADVGVGFALSTEHLNAIEPQLSQGVIVNDLQAAQAARLYYAVLDRAPDAGGLAGWTSYLKTGGTLTGAANAFLSSPESRAAGTADNATFVKSIYINALDRPADAGGLANWVGYLEGGGSRGEVTVAIANSVEAQVHLVGVIENGWFLT